MATSDETFMATGVLSNLRRDGSCRLEWFTADAAWKEQYPSVEAALDAAKDAGLQYIARRLHGFTHTETLEKARASLLGKQ